jgi:farnesyl diphosphate synthase
MPMTFEKRLVTCALDIDAQLATILSDPALERQSVPGRLVAAMSHAVLAGGKRMRPFLVIETAAIFSADAEAAMPAALALELVHCYSLVHDDLPSMDNDPMRRGKPTVWKAFDEWTAILAGDALLTLAFQVLANPAHGGQSGATRLKLIAGLARASGEVGMVGGQCLDLEADKLATPEKPDVAHIERLQAMKTGKLFEFACHAGALTGGASPREEQALTRFGAVLGAAFQLADDLLDVEGDPQTVGKATAKDAAAGKATLVGLMGVAAARKKLGEIEADALAGIEFLGARAAVLRETLHFACARKK